MTGPVRTDDFLVVGGGVIGLSLAAELKRRFPRENVTVLEKEPRCGLHASGRNSGVLHAGFYYSSDSLKARFCRDGNRELREYCRARELPMNECGKLVVPRSDDELDALDLLLERGRANGVELEELTAEEAREVEPRARVHGRALYSPTTTTVDPLRVMKALVADAKALGVEVLTDTAYQRRRRDGTIETSWGPVDAGYVVNAAGLYADRIAGDFGFSERYRVLPFKGLYLYAHESAGPFRTNVYPVPDLEKPFLGVHLTLTARGRAKLGPTAVPAFGREHYEGLEGLSVTETAEVLWREAMLFLRNSFGFRDLALEEVRKYHRPTLVRRAGRLLEGLEPEHFPDWGAPGIRAQLLDVTENRLEMDFVVEGDGESFHVLNAVSPGFTCAFPFARYLVDEIEGRVG